MNIVVHKKPISSAPLLTSFSQHVFQWTL